MLLHEGPNGRAALRAITTLQQHHLAAVPYENLELHYSTQRTLPLDTESVYSRVVVQKRGGTCIQVNLFFTQLLRSIGFQAYCTGGRLNAVASVTAGSNVDKTQVLFGAW
jgi:arylamine N-acetyltransferase